MNSPSCTNGTNSDGTTYHGGAPLPRWITKHGDTAVRMPRRNRMFIGRAATSMVVISSHPIRWVTKSVLQRTPAASHRTNSVAMLNRTAAPTAPISHKPKSSLANGRRPANTRATMAIHAATSYSRIVRSRANNPLRSTADTGAPSVSAKERTVRRSGVRPQGPKVQDNRLLLAVVLTSPRVIEFGRTSFVERRSAVILHWLSCRHASLENRLPRGADEPSGGDDWILP